METVDLLWVVFEWLPRLFVLDVLLFHLVADDPMAARWWWRRPRARSRRLRTSALL